jgi:hypothetical protein
MQCASLKRVSFCLYSGLFGLFRLCQMVSDTFRLFLVENMVTKWVPIVFIFQDSQRYIEFNKIGHQEKNCQSSLSKNPIPINYHSSGLESILSHTYSNQ